MIRILAVFLLVATSRPTAAGTGADIPALVRLTPQAEASGARRPQNEEPDLAAVDRGAEALDTAAARRVDGTGSRSVPSAVVRHDPPERVTTAAVDSASLHGTLAQATGHGSRYLAVPWGPGVTVRVTCAAGSIVLRSTDAGPSLALQRAGRIGDLALGLWLEVTGLPASRGLARGCSITRLDPIPLPPTDTEETP